MNCLADALAAEALIYTWLSFMEWPLRHISQETFPLSTCLCKLEGNN